MKLFSFAIVSFLSLVAQPVLAKVERYALLIGSNDGGPGRVILHYAVSDAQAMAKVLEQLGGIAPENRIVLPAPSRARLFSGLEKLRGVIASHGKAERSELLVYYSGHSDETGLLLGKEQLSYSELRAAVDKLSADVRIVVLDSCSSGAIIRTKGGKRVAPFLVDDSSEIRGHAFLTASSENEAAQESDRIGASYFTYALLTGLRGAADSSRDGRVTLHEAYQYAYHETLARTERSQGGPQHPAYDIQMAGTGDLVLTDLRGSSAGLVLGNEMDGRLYLRDGAGNLVAELRKIGGAPIELGLEPGRYGVTLETGGKMLAAQIDLAEGRKVELKQDAFRSVSAEAVTLRGGKPTYRVVPLNFSLLPSFELNPSGELVENYFSLSLLAASSASLRGVGISAGVSNVTDRMHGLQVSSLVNVAGELKGIQISGLVNQAGAMTGAQIGGLVNYSESIRGIQLGGIANWSANESRGYQIAPVNISRNSLQGGQIGVVSVARNTGFQVSLINIAEEASIQLGLVNVGKNVKYPIGLLNYIQGGYTAASVWMSDQRIHLGFKYGGQTIYSLFGLGGAYKENSDQIRWSPVFGMGSHFEWNRFLLEVDGTYTAFFEDSFRRHMNAHLGTLRVQGGVKFLSRWSLVAGPSFNTMVGTTGEDLNLALMEQKKYTSGDSTVRIYPGFSIGMQVRL